MASEVIACDENSQATYDNQVFLHLVFFLEFILFDLVFFEIHLMLN